MQPEDYAQRLLGIKHQYWNGLQTRVGSLQNCLTQGELPKLERVAMILTEKCNFECLYCHSRGNREIETPLALRLVDLSAEMGASYLALSGGEVTLRADSGLFEIIDRGKARAMNLVISTNGYFDVKVRDRIIARELDSINVSLDSTDARVHDDLVKIPHSWQQVVDNIKAISHHNPKVYVNSMVTNRNYQDLPERLLKFAEMFPDVADVQLIPPRNAPELCLNMDQIDEFYDLAAKVDAKVLDRFGLVKLKIPYLFGDDQDSRLRASKGVYCFDVGIPCYVSLQELHFAPRKVYSCSCLLREKMEHVMSIDFFLTDPEGNFRRMQELIASKAPFHARCRTACGPEMSAANRYLHQYAK